MRKLAQVIFLILLGVVQVLHGSYKVLDGATTAAGLPSAIQSVLDTIAGWVGRPVTTGELLSAVLLVLVFGTWVPDLLKMVRSRLGLSPENSPAKLEIAHRSWPHTPEPSRPDRWHISIRNTSQNMTVTNLRVQVVECDNLSHVLPLNLNPRDAHQGLITLPPDTAEVFDLLRSDRGANGGSIVCLPGLGWPVPAQPGEQTKIVVRATADNGSGQQTFVFQELRDGRFELAAVGDEALGAAAQEPFASRPLAAEDAGPAPKPTPSVRPDARPSCQHVLRALGLGLRVAFIEATLVSIGESRPKLRSWGSSSKSSHPSQFWRRLWFASDDGSELALDLVNSEPPGREGTRFVLMLLVGPNGKSFPFGAYNYAAETWFSLNKFPSLLHHIFYNYTPTLDKIIYVAITSTLPLSFLAKYLDAGIDERGFGLAALALGVALLLINVARSSLFWMHLYRLQGNPPC